MGHTLSKKHISNVTTDCTSNVTTDCTCDLETNNMSAKLFPYYFLKNNKGCFDYDTHCCKCKTIIDAHMMHCCECNFIGKNHCVDCHFDDYSSILNPQILPGRNPMCFPELYIVPNDYLHCCKCKMAIQNNAYVHCCKCKKNYIADSEHNKKLTHCCKCNKIWECESNKHCESCCTTYGIFGETHCKTCCTNIHPRWINGILCEPNHCCKCRNTIEKDHCCKCRQECEIPDMIKIEQDHCCKCRQECKMPDITKIDPDYKIVHNCKLNKYEIVSKIPVV